jgi:hypothetical protein
MTLAHPADAAADRAVVIHGRPWVSLKEGTPVTRGARDRASHR